MEGGGEVGRGRRAAGEIEAELPQSHHVRAAVDRGEEMEESVLRSQPVSKQSRSQQGEEQVT